MKIIFTENELNVAMKTLEKIGLDCIDLAKIVDDGDYTLEDLELPNFNDFDGVVCSLKTHHFVADGTDTEEHHLWINEDFICDVANLYTDCFSFYVSSIKKLYQDYKLLLLPILDTFKTKWQNYIRNN